MDTAPNYATFTGGRLHKCSYIDEPHTRKDGSIRRYQNVHTLCGIPISLPYPGKEGDLITAYVGGSPFPAIFESQPNGYIWCKQCQKHMAAQAPEVGGQ